MVGDKGKRSKIDEEKIDGDLVLSIEKLQDIQDDLEKLAMDRIFYFLVMWRMYVNMIAMFAVKFFYLHHVLRWGYEKKSLGGSYMARGKSRMKVLDSLFRSSDTSCVRELRMCRNALGCLCHILRERVDLVEDGKVTIEEQVAVFFNIMTHHTKNRTIQVRLYRSGETICRSCYRVLNVVLKLHDVFFTKPQTVKEDCTSDRWKWFMGCLGALDGTYIPITTSKGEQRRYRTRKGHLATNVLGACTQNMKFIYVLSGWEGSASDSKVLCDAVTRANGLKVPIGSYYLVNDGYTNSDGFLAHYRDRRYHIQEWIAGRRSPQTREELFNYKHAKAMNVIERFFGILKKRWAILSSPSFYPMRARNRMILAHCYLHNFIRMEMPVDPKENTAIIDDEMFVGGEEIGTIDSVEPTNEWTANDR